MPCRTPTAYVAYCFAPFTPGQATCSGQIGNLIGDETAWFHGADGTRVRRYVDSHFGYQEALNPGSPAAQAAYRQTTQTILGNGPIDYFFADDAGGVYIGSDGTEMTGWFYGFNAAGAFNRSGPTPLHPGNQRARLRGQAGDLNGSTPYTMQPSYNGTWLDAPNVAAQNFEGCYSDGSSAVAGDNNNRWVFSANAMLAVYATTRRACACCTRARRRRTVSTSSRVLLDDVRPAVRGRGAVHVVSARRRLHRRARVRDRADEPLDKTATSDISALSAAGGTYVREFAACYQGGSAIGPCAAVVNPHGTAASMPALSGKYSTSLALDNTSMYSGGKANGRGPSPSRCRR